MSLTKLKRFWHALECLRGQAAVYEEWRLCLGTEFAAAQTLLRPTREVGGYFPRADPLNRRRYRSPCRVIDAGDDRFWAIPPDGGPSVDVCRTQLAVYELHRSRLLKGFQANWDLQLHSPQSVEGIEGLFNGGVVTPVAGYRFGLYLSFPRSKAETRRMVDAIAGDQEAPFLLLVPTPQFVDPAIDRVLTRRLGAAVPLSETLAVSGSNTVLTSGGRERISQFLTKHLPPAPDQETTFFPTPAEASWSHLQMRFVDGETLSVRVGEVTAVVNYTQMGMASAKNGRPTVQWELLRLFADSHGQIDWSNRAANHKLQKRKNLLARHLRRFFRIEGDPIVSQGNGWQTQFRIQSDR